jgi:hypothetical protein
MNRNYLLLIFCIIALNPFTASGQIANAETRGVLNKTNEALKNIKTVVFKVNHAKKYFSRNDTTDLMRSLRIAVKKAVK